MVSGAVEAGHTCTAAVQALSSAAVGGEAVGGPPAQAVWGSR
jgi:hypothetical protein